MLRKALRWLLIIGLTLIVLLGIVGVGVYYYVQENEHRAVREAAEQLGLEVTYATAKPTFWSTFPRVSLAVDSVTIRDLNRSGKAADLLYAERIRAGLSLRKMWRDTLIWETLSLENARIYLAADSTGQYNLGTLTEPRDSSIAEAPPVPPSLLNPHIDLNGVSVRIKTVAVTYVDPPKQKAMAVRFDSALVDLSTIAPGEVAFSSCLNAFVGGLSFNTKKGSYLQDRPLAGCITAGLRDSVWTLDPAELRVGEDTFTLGGSVGPEGLHLHIENDSLDYDRARVLLHDTLQVRLADYHVAGPFGVVADVYNYPGGGNDVELSLQFKTRQQPVRIKAFQFENVTTRGTFTNRLPAAMGGTPGSTTEFLIVTDTTQAVYDGMLIRSPRAYVRGWPTDAYLDSPINLTGQASALARLFGNTDFQFTAGSFAMNTHVAASLNRVDEIINTSDGDLTLRDLRVNYVPAEVRFPFRRIRLDKLGKDVRFDLQSGNLATGLSFNLVGYLDNILPLLLDRPADSLRTEVIFHTERGDWAGFRALFEEDGYFDAQSPQTLSQEEQVRRMKKTLLGLGNKFRPHLQMVIDTLAYYDVLTLGDFRAGLLFDRDVLVLEKSRFDWEDGTIAMRARIDLGKPRQTPFSLGVVADQLDLNALRAPLTTFGMQLPEGLHKLPESLDVAFTHEGVINDALGIRPGHNYGSLTFSDGRDQLFAGSVDYAPGPEGLQTNLHLSGDPVMINDLFAARDFFFGSGRFQIDLTVRGQPATLEELMKQSDLKLVVDSSRITYQPAGVFVPLKKMEVAAIGDETNFELSLFSNTTRRAVRLHGVMDRLSAFLYPKDGDTFDLRATLSAEHLHVSDVYDFLQKMPEDTTAATTGFAPDSVAFDPQLFLSTTGGVFNTFNPHLTLGVDTFQVDDVTTFSDLHARIRLLDSTLLLVEDTGFSLGEGSVTLSASYSLDQLASSPFTVQWEGKALSLAGIEHTLHHLGISGDTASYHLRGTVSSFGDVRGVIDESSWAMPYDGLSGAITFNLTGGEVADLPLLEKIGRKAMMRKRFEKVLVGPLSLAVRMEGGRMDVPLTELQSTALQLFVEGRFDTVQGPDLLISIPLRNIGRGLLTSPPPPTGYALAGRKVYVVVEPDKFGETKVRFRLGRRKYYRQRGKLDELRQLKQTEKATRRQARKQRRKNR